MGLFPDDVKHPQYLLSTALTIAGVMSAIQCCFYPYHWTLDILRALPIVVSRSNYLSPYSVNRSSHLRGNNPLALLSISAILLQEIPRSGGRMILTVYSS
ncbi:hypothetical protein GGU10DRAFT_381697 [Lentinula aff. detonsa]|uniref:Uncharacterized protein n=1 Tax=Lentinula aff. detonsa TaxID=2804958 RepID=A0AA38KW53_9AGAR|nr:hypothetical protein GGU10DRAFT_381697 [Lentinula aff. detonsa]